MGSGASGCVWKVVNTETGTTCALKFVGRLSRMTPEVTVCGDSSGCFSMGAGAVYTGEILHNAKPRT